MFSNDNAIGIFDSGVGGLTLLDRLMEILPHESFEYFGDSGNCPYGDKSIDEILAHTLRITDYLRRKNCKMIIVACNTITTNIIAGLRARYHVPIVGMEPGTKPAFKESVNKQIGILATEGTLKGELYNKTLANYHDKASFTGQIGYGLVELIEQDQVDSPEMKEKLESLLQPMIDRRVDALVLGCTHYHFLTHVIRDIFPYPIKIIDTTEAVARQAARVLKNKNLLSSEIGRTVNIVTSGDLELLEKIIKRLSMSRLTNGHFPALKASTTT